MFQVTANPEKNRLYITLEGHLGPEERLVAGKAFMSAIRELQPGFDIIHDMAYVCNTHI